jgi:uncharacterized protein YndB with AHSA1/START domain
MNTDPDRIVRVTHRFKASAQTVFDAWLNPDLARRWLFATDTGTMVRAEVDARVGGRFNFTDRRDGDDIEHVGEYLEIDRPRKLVFSFGVPKFSEVMTRVTIEIEPLPVGCELRLTHEGVLPDYLERTKAGWTMILEKLASDVD